MILDRAVRDHLEAEPQIDLSTMDPVDARRVLHGQLDRNFARFGEPGPAMHSVTEHRIDAGTHSVRVVLHRPRPGRLGVCLLLHGGGFMSGSPDLAVSVAEAAHRAAGAGVVVAALAYRLAPEHPFPAALDDVVTALHWLREEGPRFDLDPANLTLDGNSAGGNLAAAAVLAAPETPLRGLVLEVPVLDVTGRARHDSRLAEFAPADFDLLKALYLPAPEVATSPLVSPLRATDLSGFPPTVIHTAALDPLARDGAAFAERLRAAGVPVTLRTYEGALHGSPLLTKTWGTAARWQREVVAALAEFHHPGGVQISAKEQARA